MRRSTVVLSLSILSPALLAGCSNRDCDERYENCVSRGGYVGGVYRSTGSGAHVSGSGHSVGGTARGGFGGFGGFGGGHGFGG